MKTKPIVIFVTGYLIGDFIRARIIRKKLYKLVPLIENAVRSVTIRAIENNLSKDQISELMEEEYHFMCIVTKK